ncbi:MAG: ABC-2 family transporter protein [Lacipirellulaceae bacterium]
MSPNYLAVFLTFARNSLIRDMTFRTNFFIEVISSMSWMIMNLGFYTLVYQFTPDIEGWGKYQFFVFIATTMFINSLVQAFFMPNAQELSELVRTGGLDFALLKPIDTQFLVSLRRVNWSSLGNFGIALVLLAYALPKIENLNLSIWQFLLYPAYILMGVLILYSVMMTLAATSIWLGRNQSLYDFWFYITNFSRYPMEIYKGTYGEPLRNLFTFVIPILVVINVPANLMAKPLGISSEATTNRGMQLALFTLLATAGSLAFSRWIFKKALGSYRSASS